MCTVQVLFVHTHDHKLGPHVQSTSNTTDSIGEWKDSDVLVAVVVICQGACANRV